MGHLNLTNDVLTAVTSLLEFKVWSLPDFLHLLSGVSILSTFVLPDFEIGKQLVSFLLFLFKDFTGRQKISFQIRILSKKGFYSTTSEGAF